MISHYYAAAESILFKQKLSFTLTIIHEVSLSAKHNGKGDVRA
jgi:hypothetical protein